MRVLIIDIDSLRPDHLGCYGYDRKTSPTIDTIADDGVRFDRCFVSDSPCLPSRTALATCRLGIKTGVVTHYGQGQWYDNPGSGHDPDENRMLSFQQLAQHGVRTASVSSFGQRHMAYHFSSAFQDSMQPTAETGVLAIEDASDVTETALTWLDGHASNDDWLLHVNYWDVHHPYQEIEEYVDEVRDSGEAAPWPDTDAIEEQQGMTGPRTADLWPNPSEYGEEWFEEKYDEWSMPEQFTDRANAEHVIDGYDASIRKVDDEVATLLAALEEMNVREKTAVIVTGDHGEALGEHGIYAEHAMPHPPCQQVPLIVSWPDVTDEHAGNGVDTYVYQFDLMPTICELFDVPIPSAWDAASFREAFSSDEFEGREQIVSGHGIYTFGRALYRDNTVYIRLLHPGVFSYPNQFNDPEMLPGRGLELLHDLESDPYMTENLIQEQSELAAEMRSRLDAWLVENVSQAWYNQRPSEARGRDPLAQMTTDGPFLYIDPEPLLELYHDIGRSAEQIAALERSLNKYSQGQ